MIPAAAGESVVHQQNYYMLKIPEAIPVLTIVKLLNNAYLPTKATTAAVGFDVFALENSEIRAWDIVKLRTGLRATPPDGHYLRVTGRSGLTSEGFLVLQGVVDPDYTGEILVMVLNATPFIRKVTRGNRIAQLVPEKYASNCTAVVLQMDNHMRSSDATAAAAGGRGTKGFGSSGL